MSLLEELNAILSPIISIETGVFSQKAPDRYVVLTPISDDFEVFCDNAPTMEIQEIRVSLFDKNNYTKIKNRIIEILLKNNITITFRQFIERENDTGYYHYAIDVAKEYEYETEVT